MQSPRAPQVLHTHSLHGDVRTDEYHWLRNRDDPAVITYLTAENEYHQTMMAPLASLTNHLYEEMVARIPDVEQGVPEQDGPYFYYTQSRKDLAYPISMRKRAASRADLASAAEEVVLDSNSLATEGGYLSVTVQTVSPAHDRLAYLENRDGSDRYTAFVKDLTTGELLPDRIEGVFIGQSLVWDASGEYLFYVVTDDSQRPYRLYRHRIGDTVQDDLLYEESDITFSIALTKTRSGAFLLLTTSSKTSSETHFLRADQPLSALQRFAERRPLIEYELEHWGDDFLILTNEDATNFKIQSCPIDAPSLSSRLDLIAHDSARYLQSVVPFARGLLIAGRQDGLTQLWVFTNGTLRMLTWEEDIYTVTVGGNRSYDTSEVLIRYESLLTPRTTYSFDLDTGAKTPLQVAPVSGTYAKESYVQERLWAPAPDGALIPVLLVYRKDVRDTGPAPTLLNGYGSYGANSDPRFDPYRLPLLEQGVVFAIAQIRGGSEMGRHWYEDGKLLRKRNTFTDFIAAAEHLVAEGYTTPSQLAALGRSAGGLLIGGVVNMSDDLFAAVLAGVPFVDVVTTMLDASIPLTSLEWDEWGNPEDAQYYEYMKSYSPYDNVSDKKYPHMLVTTGLNDPRVAYWEPAKWVARLRTCQKNDRQLLLQTNLGAGHFGASGRLPRLRELAADFAFLLDKIGVPTP